MDLFVGWDRKWLWDIVYVYRGLVDILKKKKIWNFYKKIKEKVKSFTLTY